MIATLCTITLPALIAQVHAKDPMQQLVEKLQSPGSMDEFADKLLNKFANRALKTYSHQSADKFMDRAKLDDTTLGKETVKSMQLQLASAESSQQLSEEKALNATRSMELAESKATRAQSAQKAAEEKAARATQKMQSAASTAAQARSAQRAAEAKSTQEIRSADSKAAHAQALQKAAEDKAQSAESGEAKARAAKKAAQVKALQEEKLAKQEEEQKAQAESEAARARAAQKAMAAKASQMEQQLNFTKSEAMSLQSVKKTQSKEVNQKSLDATAGSLTQLELAEPSTRSAFFTMLFFWPTGCAVAMESASALGNALAKRRNLLKAADASEHYVTLV